MSLCCATRADAGTLDVRFRWAVGVLTGEDLVLVTREQAREVRASFTRR